MTKRRARVVSRAVGTLAGLLGGAMVLEGVLGNRYDTRARWGLGMVGAGLVGGATALELLSE